MSLNQQYQGSISELTAGKNAFYQQVGAAKAAGYSNEQVANMYANNPFGVSFQELLATPASTYNTPYTPKSGGSGGGGYNATAAANQAYIADQNALIDQSLARAGNQFNIGNANIMDAYNAAYARLTGDKDIANRNYKTSRTNTQQDNIEAKAGINENVKNQYTGIQRLLGSRGAGNSSAAQILAPYAAGKVGNIQRGQVQKAYGRNMGALDTNWQDTERQYNDSFGQLDADKQNNLRSNESTYNSLQAQLLGQRAAIDPNNRASYQARINDLLAQVDNLGRKVTYTPKAVNVKPVDLQQYNYDKYNAPSAGSNPSAINQGAGPYWTLIGDKTEEEKKVGIV
jgi:hypothetical protein